jgi:hypothetical protein
MQTLNRELTTKPRGLWPKSKMYMVKLPVESSRPALIAPAAGIGGFHNALIPSIADAIQFFSGDINPVVRSSQQRLILVLMTGDSYDQV